MLTELSCRNFARELASAKPVPGGGGTAALLAALGTALNTMVANFSKEKKKLEVYTDEYKDLISKGEIFRERLIDLIDKDADCFLPLSKAYEMADESEEEKKLKEAEIQKCLKKACRVPMETLKYAYEAILMHKEIQDKSAEKLISDVGIGIQCLKSSLCCTYINVINNLNLITDEDFVREQKEILEEIFSNGILLADKICIKVIKSINE